MDENNNTNEIDVNKEISSIKSSIENMQDNLNRDYDTEANETSSESTTGEVTTEDTSNVDSKEASIESAPNEENGKSLEDMTNIEDKSDKNKKGKGGLIVIILLLLVAAFCAWLFIFGGKDLLFGKDSNEKTSTEIKPGKYKSEYRMSGNSLENFDLYFLKLENEKVNKIYSPLSIKYALEMLNEGAEGDTKEQISAVVGDYTGKKYVNSENMSLANALFIKNSFKDSINSSYIDTLKEKYDAEISYDEFKTVDNLNSWVKNKTLNLIDNLFTSIPDETNFILINALAIDMDWKKIIQPDKMMGWSEMYKHENFIAYVSSLVSSGYHTLTFNDNYSAKSVEVGAAINNYDIVKDIGEDKIRETVGEKYREFLEKDECNDAATRPDVDTYLDSYIEEISTGYGKYASSTDFLVYVDDDVKAFAKELKEYNGTTLQYIGIMPIGTSLDEYINNADATSISSIINNLKTIESKSFKEGVITKIKGYIPLFKFEYTLNLQEDLKKLGIVDVFDKSKSNLSKLSTSPGVYISSTIHKANIEFSNEGIKAAAATAMGGAGAGGCDFDYMYDVPVEEIDITFDKPYMFIIRDKSTGEVWFTGTVYEPINWSDEQKMAEQEELYKNR